jgi:hypothetical protein
VLVEAGIVEGRTITSWPSLQTDVRDAGGSWVDEEVHVDRTAAILVTSRKPDDIPAFSAKAIEELCEGEHETCRSRRARRPPRRGCARPVPPAWRRRHGHIGL